MFCNMNKIRNIFAGGLIECSPPQNHKPGRLIIGKPIYLNLKINTYLVVAKKILSKTQLVMSADSRNEKSRHTLNKKLPPPLL